MKDEIENKFAPSHGVDAMVAIFKLIKDILLTLLNPLVDKVDGFRESVVCLFTNTSDDPTGWGLMHDAHQPRLIEILPVINLKFILGHVTRPEHDSAPPSPPTSCFTGAGGHNIGAACCCEDAALSFSIGIWSGECK